MKAYGDNSQTRSLSQHRPLLLHRKPLKSVAQLPPKSHRKRNPSILQFINRSTKANDEEVVEIQGQMCQNRILDAIQKVWISHRVSKGEKKYIEQFISCHKKEGEELEDKAVLKTLHRYYEHMQKYFKMENQVQSLMFDREGLMQYFRN